MIDPRPLLLALAAAQGAFAAEPTPGATPRADDYATCAAFYFNAVNVKPMGAGKALVTEKTAGVIEQALACHRAQPDQAR